MMRRLSLVALSSLIIGAALAPGAGAANVTVGPDLTESYTPVVCGVPCTYVNSSVSGLGARAVSPVSGEVVAWGLAGNTTGAEYRLRVMTPVGSGKYVITASSSGEIPTAAYSASFATAIPIVAGQTIGLDLSKNASIGVSSPLLGTSALGWEPVPAEGLTPVPTYSGPETEYSFNAEIQPSPTVASLSVASGPLAGGTAVTLTGADLEGVTSVRFGSAVATFTAKSESAIDAVAPAAASPGGVPVTVTTNAGSGTASQQFTYEAPATSAPSPTPATSPVGPTAPTCKVPALQGKSLKISKRRIRASDCKVGKVTKKKGAKAGTGKVVGQSKKPGTELPAGTVVKVTLGKS